MAVSKLLATTGSFNDFSVDITSTNTVASFPKEYPIGAYAVTSTGTVDTTYDIYALNSAGTQVGYTKGSLLTVTGGFNKLVIVGQTTGNLLEFKYKSVYTASDASTNADGGPVITSASVSDLPNIDNTTVITGRNFATGITAAFTGTGYTSTAAKVVTRTNASSITITRPDNMPLSGSPYTLTLTNPGMTDPTGSNAHILSNAFTVGNAPVWSTAATLPVYTKTAAYSQTVIATDADGGSSVTYSTVTNSLPSGLSITGSGNVISGTPTVLTSGSVVLRATDSGGNFVDRTFTIANVGVNAPVFTSALPSFPVSGSAYTHTITATDDSGAGPAITLFSGTLPTGLTFTGGNGTATLSGTTSDSTVRTLTFRATDANGTTTDQVVTPFRASVLTQTTFTASGTFTPVTSTINNLLVVGGGAAGGGTNNYGNGGSGGGGGGFVSQTSSISVTPGTAYAIVIGAGGVKGNCEGAGGFPVLGSIGQNGNTSSAFGQQAFGGQGGVGAGNSWSQPKTSQRGPGGGAASYGFGSSSNSTQVCDQGQPGRDVDNNSSGGGGGATSNGGGNGAGGAAGNTWSINGVQYGGGGGGGNSGTGGAGGGGNGVGGGAGNAGTTYGGGGGGIAASSPASTNGGAGYQGIVIVYAFA